MIGYKNTISRGSSIMQPIRIPENTRNVILVMILIIHINNYKYINKYINKYLNIDNNNNNNNNNTQICTRQCSVKTLKTEN